MTVSIRRYTQSMFVVCACVSGVDAVVWPISVVVGWECVAVHGRMCVRGVGWGVLMGGCVAVRVSCVSVGL